ncbi:heart- and neural crest derivatives-expressed protein 2-like [Palaemon carinicauda]|uniref:heart- and neural crest derivatives-expressed protein 2-like n=1 Tax=Palaemon carinicauda TaxID=392227 RepID=UPI0035B676E9
MSLVGGYSMPQTYGHAAMGTAAPSHDAIYSPYYSHPSPPGQALYSGWGYAPPGFSQRYSPEVAVACQDYGVSGGFVVGPGSPHDLTSEYTIEMVDGCGRVVKRRSSANKKERRRTQSINNAFAELRECIPNVPADTKLSKIKTLRLATSYIAYLMEVLHSEDPQQTQQQPPQPFRADLHPAPTGNRTPTQVHVHAHHEKEVCDAENSPNNSHNVHSININTGNIPNITASTNNSNTSPECKRGRTGWPQEVWAQELKK